MDNNIESVALIVAILSFTVSLTTLYISHIKPPKIKAFINNRISFYPIPEIVGGKICWGGTGFYIPVTFQNISNNPGSVINSRLIIEREDKPSDNFDISWYMLCQLHKDEHRIVHVSYAQPIAISGSSSDSNIILFAWRKKQNPSIPIEEGKYNITFLAWTKDEKNPQIIYKNNFYINKDTELEYKENLRREHPATIDLILGENSRDNTILSSEQVSQIYKIP